MTFEEWWNRQMVAEWWEKQTMWPSEYNTAKAAWQAAQAAERERTTAVILKCLNDPDDKLTYERAIEKAIKEINELDT